MFEPDCSHLSSGSRAGGADSFAVRSAGSLWAQAGEDRKGFGAMGLLLWFVSHSVGSLGWV